MASSKLFDQVVPPSVSLSAAAQLAGKNGSNRDQLRQEIRKPLDADSFYGKILQETVLELTNGEKYTWEYLNPFALLHQMTAWSPRFGDLLQHCMRGGKVRLVFYQDEIKPGNILRPDAGRSLVCYYWSILEFPGVSSCQCG